MDIVGKETLESMMKDFPGSILFVSHDRYFIKQIADALLVFEGDTVQFFPYGYDDYIEYRDRMNALISEQTIKTPAASAKVQEEAPVQKGKESYNQGKERARLERKIKKLEEKIAEVEAAIEEKKEELAKPEYASSYSKLSEISAEIEEKECELLELMEEWEELDAQQSEMN